ncbi:MAG TPA: DUF4352 domain-containing protein [Candidatus Dormibacteraeota bacterium]|jgi:hypothetical protein
MTYPPQPPQYGQQPPVSGPPGQQAYGYAPQQPPKKRKKWPWIVGGIALVMILGCVGAFALLGAGANEVAESLDEADQNQKGNNAVAGVMGKPAKDGKFEFTVTKMKCGVDSVGPDGFGQKAQGEFCLVSVNVKNVGTTAELFNDSSQQATAGANTYSVDSGAGVYANEESSTFLQDINPGNTVKGDLVFDVPKGTKLESVVLHESMFTAGIKVPLK